MKLSIIIPVYNCAPYLKEGFKHLEKVYNLLSSEEFEIIYVNDGSTDNSKELLEEIAIKKENIKVIHQENQGSSGARNTAIDIATGKYLQFLDSDDYINFEKIIPLLQYSLENNLDALSYRIGFIDEKGNSNGEMQKHPLTYNKIMTGGEALIEGFQPSSICCWLFKKDFLNEHKLRIYPKITHMDVEFTTRMLIRAKKVIFKDIIAYFYVSRPGSITKPKTKEKLESFLYDEVIVAGLIKEQLKFADNKDLKIAIIKNYNSIVWNLLWRFYKNPNEVDTKFREKCIYDLKEKNLYPIKGNLKTPFQNISRIFMNNSLFLNKFIIK